MKVLDLIRQQAVYHGRALYAFAEHRWDFPPCSERRKGVYIFASLCGDILKVGKSDGRFGLCGRLNQYRANSASFLRNSSSSASVIKCVQGTSKSVAIMEIYYIPIEPVSCMLAGLSLMVTPARELELALAALARDEGHSLRFAPNS